MSEFIVYISNGVITNKAKVKQAFSELKEGKYLVRIDSIKKRTIQQNRYYFGCMVPLVKEGLRDAGYDEVKTNEDAHEVIKAIFLKRKIRSKVNDDEIEIGGSTAKLTTTQFNELIDDVIKWAATYLNTQIAYPNEPLMMFNEPPVVLATYQGNDLITLVTEV